MTRARIEEGDLLIVEEDEATSDGAGVVALLDAEEVTVKKLYREAERTLDLVALGIGSE